MPNYQGVQENEGLIEGEGPVAESVQYIPDEMEAGSDAEKSDAQLISEEQGADEQKPDEEGAEKTAKKPEKEQEAEPKPEDKPKEKKKPELPKGAMKRINKLTARNYDLKKELATAQAELERLKGVDGEKKLSDKIAENEKAKPNKEDFESYEDYLEAHNKWGIKAELLNSEKEKAEGEKKEKKDPVEDSNDYNEMVEGVIKDGLGLYEDFEEVVHNPDLKLSEEALLASLESDIAHEILYYLGNNPEESAKIFAMSKRQTATAIGKLEAKLAYEAELERTEEELDVSEERKPAEAKKQEKQITKAPEPIESISGKTVQKKDLNSLSNAEYRERRGYDRRGQRKT